MKTLIREFSQKDYAEIIRWVQDREYPFPDYALLPGIGFVAEQEGLMVAVGFLYRMGAGVAMISSLYSNPSVEKLSRQEAVNFVIQTLVGKAKDLKIKRVTVASNIDRIVDRFKDLGFLVGDKNVTHLYMEI